MNKFWLVTLPFLLNIIHGIGANETNKLLKSLEVEVDGTEPNRETHATRTSSKCAKFNFEFIPRKKRSAFQSKIPEYPNTFTVHSPFSVPTKDEISKVTAVSEASDPSSFKNKCDEMKRNHCGECDVSFRYDIHYADHCKVQHGIKYPFSCDACERAFSSKRTLLYHENAAHGLKNNPHAGWKKNEPMVCDVCQESLRGWMKFEEHALSKHKGKKMMRCSYCPEKFLRRKRVLMHEKTEHRNLEVMCKFCKNIFGRSDFLKEHLNFCQQRQIQNKMGDKQVETKIRSSVPICKECGEEYKTITLLRYHHRLKHPHVKLYPCDHCDAAFSFLKTLERHVLMLHPDKTVKTNKWRKFRRGTIYTCEYCKENFKGTLAYQKHGKQHPGMPMFRCKDCGLGYGMRKSLSNHVNEVHGCVKKRCSYCSKCYFKIGTHEKCCKIKIENRERKRMAGYPKHHCGICDQDLYMFDTSFRAHLMRHKYYECCVICGQGFKKNSNRLRRHMVLRHPSGDNALETAGVVTTLEKPESTRQNSEMEDFKLGDMSDLELDETKDLAYAKCEDHDLYIYAKSEETD